MATRYQQQATKQLNPVYAQSQKAIQSQLPAVEQLYQTLTQGLQQQNQMQLDSGVQNIVEDASARGVLRSTLPVDARQSLVAQLGAALNQSLGQLGAQRAQDISGINQQLGQLNIQRSGNIADLARALESQDLQRDQFNFQKSQSKQELALKKQALAASGTSTKTPSQAAIKSALKTSIQQDIKSFFSTKNANREGYTEDVVIPRLIEAYPELSAQEIFDIVYPARMALLRF